MKYLQTGVSENRVPQNGWIINGNPLLKWMIWGCLPYFWKHLSLLWKAFWWINSHWSTEKVDFFIPKWFSLRSPQRLQASFCLLQRFFRIRRHLGRLSGWADRPRGRRRRRCLPGELIGLETRKKPYKKGTAEFRHFIAKISEKFWIFIQNLNSKKKKKKKLNSLTLKVVGQSLCLTFALSYFPMIFSHRPHDVHDHRSLWPGVNLRFVQLEVCSWFNLVPCGPIQDRPKQTLIPKW